MNYTMENAWRYLPKPCANPDSHDGITGCYECRVAFYSNVQGATTIAEALTAEGWPAFVEQAGGFNMVVYVHGSYGKALGCTAKSGVVFYESVTESEGVPLNSPDEITPSDSGCAPETLATIVSTVKKYAYKLEVGADVPLFTEGV